MPVGLNQINQPTPKWAKMAFRIFFYTTSIATIAMSTFTGIPDNVKLLVSSYVIQANTLVYSISKLFGISADDSFPTAAPNDAEIRNQKNS